MVYRVETSASATLQQEGLLSQNAYFESGIAGWQGLNGVLTHSNERASQGSFSAKMVPTGGIATAIIQTLPGNQGGDASVVPNVQYRFWFKMWSDLAWANCEPVITWRNEDGSVAFGTSVGPTFNHPGSSWVEMEMLATCPAGATRAQLRCRKSNTPPNTQTFFVDEVCITPSSVAKGVLARAFLGPTVYGTRWKITRMATTINSESDTELRVYRNQEQASTLIDSTYNGKLATSDTSIELGTLEKLIFVWSGGNAGSICTATMSGELLGRS